MRFAKVVVVIGGGTHTTCMAGTCFKNHPVSAACTDGNAKAFVADLDNVRAELAKGDIAKAIKLAEAGDDHVRYNAQRNAIQAFGCNDVLVAHFAL